MKSKKIVYIAGYSRSGSTILDIILSSHPAIFGTGELAYLFDDWLQQDRLCTCGEPYGNCRFWKQFALPAGMDMETAKSVVRKVESRSSLKALVNGQLPEDIIEKYKQIQISLYSYIAGTSQKDIIIDSSKTSRDMAGRFYALHRYTDFDVYVIHLVKNGVSVVESYVKKGRNWALEGYGKNDRFVAARSSMGWYLANSIARKLGAKLPRTHVLQINYEELVSQPETVLQSIGSMLELDMSGVMENIQSNVAFHPQHNVGGNRLRLEKEVRFAKTNGFKKSGLSLYHRFIFKAIAGRLHKQFGY